MRGYKLLLVLGTVLVVGVIAWRLLGSSYARDVRTICEAEARSGASVGKEPVKVANWMKTNVDSPEGVALVTDLQQKRRGDGAAELAAEAKRVKLSSCPLADAYAKIQTDSDYKSDVARLCSGLEFPNLETQSDADRMNRMKEWVDKQAKSPKTASLVHELEGLPPNERGKRLRDEASANDKFMCEVGAILDRPKATSSSTGPQVNIHDLEVNGNLAQDVVLKEVQDLMPKIKKCYTDTLATKPDLKGRIITKVSISDKGVKTADAASLFPDAGVVACVHKALEGLPTAPTAAAGAVVLVPIDFTPN